MSSRKTAGRRATTKKRAQRATSNVFAMFDHAQIAEFKEAFNMIDQNRDGFVEKEDLHDMLASLGNFLYSFFLNVSTHTVSVYFIIFNKESVIHLLNFLIYVFLLFVVCEMNQQKMSLIYYKLV